MSLRVNGVEILQDEIDREFQRLKPDYDRFVREQNADGGDEQLLEWARENLVERELIRQAASELPDAEETDNADDDELPDAEAVLQRKVDRLMEQVGDTAAPPVPEEIKDYYRAHRQEFRTPEQVRASHIVKHTSHGEDRTQAYLEILNVKSGLEQGVSFEELAQRHSDCPDEGGDLGYFPRGQMVPEFEDVVFAMAVDEVSDVFETPFGFHIAKVYDRHAGGPVPLDDVADQIQERLFEERRTKALEDFVDALKARATIEELDPD